MPLTQETSLKLRKWELPARAGSLGLTWLPLCSVREQGSSREGPGCLQQELRDTWGLCSALLRAAGVGLSTESVLVRVYWRSVGDAGYEIPRPPTPAGAAHGPPGRI